MFFLRFISELKSKIENMEKMSLVIFPIQIIAIKLECRTSDTGNFQFQNTIE